MHILNLENELFVETPKNFGGLEFIFYLMKFKADKIKYIQTKSIFIMRSE